MKKWLLPLATLILLLALLPAAPVCALSGLHNYDDAPVSETARDFQLWLPGDDGPDGAVYLPPRYRHGDRGFGYDRRPEGVEFGPRLARDSNMMLELPRHMTRERCERVPVYDRRGPHHAPKSHLAKHYGLESVGDRGRGTRAERIAMLRRYAGNERITAHQRAINLVLESLAISIANNHKRCRDRQRCLTMDLNEFNQIRTSISATNPASRLLYDLQTKAKNMADQEEFGVLAVMYQFLTKKGQDQWNKGVRITSLKPRASTVAGHNVKHEQNPDEVIIHLMGQISREDVYCNTRQSCLTNVTNKIRGISNQHRGTKTSEILEEMISRIIREERAEKFQTLDNVILPSMSSSKELSLLERLERERFPKPIETNMQAWERIQKERGMKERGFTYRETISNKKKSRGAFGTLKTGLKAKAKDKLLVAGEGVLGAIIGSITGSLGVKSTDSGRDKRTQGSAYPSSGYSSSFPAAPATAITSRTGATAAPYGYGY